MAYTDFTPALLKLKYFRSRQFLLTLYRYRSLGYKNYFEISFSMKNQKKLGFS